MIQYGLLSLSHAARLEVLTAEEGNGAGVEEFSSDSVRPTKFVTRCKIGSSD